MKNVDLICIGCPMGCMLQATMQGKKVMDVKGYTCKLGKEYAFKELTNPTRIVTSTVPVIHGVISTISVKTQNDIPKNKIFECIQELKNIVVTAPISIGDVVVGNIAGTGVNIIATRECLACEN